jgi:hypothetical protein
MDVSNDSCFSPQDEDTDLCDEAAREGFAMLDQLEAQDNPP